MEDFGDGLFIQGIGAKAIDCLGGKGNQASLPQDLGRLLEIIGGDI